MTYRDNFNLIDWSDLPAPEIKVEHQSAVSDLPFPMIISDAMPATEHVDGRFYESKSGFRRITKANGLIEVGNDAPRTVRPKRPSSDKAISDAIDRALARAS